MLGRVFLVRHAEMDEPKDAPRDELASTLESLTWGVTPRGHAQADAIGKLLKELGLPGDTACLTGTATRFRETAHDLTIAFGENLRWFAEEYLNARPRGLKEEPEIRHRALYDKKQLTDQAISEFMSLGPQRLQRRIRERFANSENLIVVTTGELIKGFLARIEGWTPLQIVKNFRSKIGPNSLEEGEIIEISSRDPVSNESVDSFRYKRKLSPMSPEPVSAWEYFEVPRYTASELIDPKIWGEK